MYSGEFSAWPKRVHYGDGSLKKLPELMASLGRKRAMIVCGQSVASGVMLQSVKEALGVMYAGAFTDVRAHTPIAEVARAAEQLRQLGADTVISVGGGSAIDAAKGVVLFISTDGDLRPYSIQYAAQGMERKKLSDAQSSVDIRHIAIPTTAGSGSDVMPTAGLRDPQLKKKILFWDERLVPDATILDPNMAIHAGPRLTAASGMTAVARSIESLYSKHRNPVSTALALHSVRLMRTSLPVSVNEPGNLEARLNCQLATVMASTASINAMASLVHAIGHGVGGRYELQHGVAHAMLLGPTLHKLLPFIGDDYSAVLDGLGCPPARSAEEAAEVASTALNELLAQLPLPQRLREVGVQDSDIPDMARATMNEFMMANLPEPLDVSDVESVLRRAW